LRLGSLDDVVHELLDRQATPLGVGPLGVLAGFAQALSREQHFPLADIEDLDVDGDLQLAPGGRGLCAECHGNVGLILDDDAANDGVRLGFRSVAHAEPALQLGAHLRQQLLLHVGGRRMVLERHDGHRVDVRRQSPAAESIGEMTPRRRNERQRANDRYARSTHQKPGHLPHG